MYSYKWYTYILTAVALVLQPYFNKWLIIGFAYPDILLIVLLLSSLGKKSEQVIVLSCVSGFIFDLLYSRYIGPVTILLLLRAFLIIAIGRRFNKENVFMVTLSAVLMVLVSRAYTILWGVGFRDFIALFDRIIQDILYSAIYTGLIVLVITTIMLITYNAYASTSRRLLYGHNKKNN